MSPDVNRGSTRSRAGNASSDVSGLAAAQAALVAALTADADIPPGFDARGVEALARVLARKRLEIPERPTTPPSRWQQFERRVRQLIRWLLPPAQAEPDIKRRRH
jgi:hypothetical protein